MGIIVIIIGFLSSAVVVHFVHGKGEGYFVPSVLVLGVMTGGMVMGSHLSERNTFATQNIAYSQKIEVGDKLVVVSKDGETRFVPNGYIVIGGNGQFYLIKN